MSKCFPSTRKRKPGVFKFFLFGGPNRSHIHSITRVTETLLELLSLKCRKSFTFALVCVTMKNDWLNSFAPLFHLITCKTKTNQYSLARVFARFPAGLKYFLRVLIGSLDHPRTLCVARVIISGLVLRLTQLNITL